MSCQIKAAGFDELQQRSTLLEVLMARIRVKNGPHKGAEFNVKDDSLIIGRDEISDGIQILDQGVSRRHAEIFRIGEMYFIRDLGSRNGTYVNEEKVTEELLRVGDEVKIGSTLMVFEDKRSKIAKDSGRIGSSGNLDTLAATTVIRIGDSPTDDDLTMDPGQETQESRDLQVLYKVAKTLASERDVKGLSKKVIRLSAEAIGADHGYCFIRHSERGEITLSGAFEKEGKKAPVVSKNIIRRVLKFGRAVMTSDASTDDRFRDHGSVVMKQIRAVICAPLVTTDQLAGVLYLSTSKLTEAFSSEDLELVTAVGIQAGMAIQGMSFQLAQEKSYLELVGALVAAVELREPNSEGHSQRVASYSSGIAQALGLSSGRNRRVQLAAMLHNIGDLFLEEADRQLEDLDLLARRIDLGATFVDRLKGMSFLLPAIRHSGERWNGLGVPDGLAAEDIPLESRIIAGAHDFDEHCSLADAVGEDIPTLDVLKRMRAEGGRYDPRVLDAIERAHTEGWLYSPSEHIKV
jgi:HD-GYP domain-containing protein (c-di-GMP phosphodiesterase class II)